MSLNNGYTIPSQAQTNIPVRVTRLEAYVKKLLSSEEVKKKILLFFQSLEAENGLTLNSDGKLVLGGELNEDTVITLNGKNLTLKDSDIAALYIDTTNGNGVAGIALTNDGNAGGSIALSPNSGIVTILSSLLALKLEAECIITDGSLYYLPDGQYSGGAGTFSPSNNKTTYQLGNPTQNSVLVFPGFSTPFAGRHLEVDVLSDSEDFTWSTSTNYRKNDGTESNELLNGHFYQFRSNGYFWRCINK